MSKRAKEAALKVYPKQSRLSEPHGVIAADYRPHYLGDANEEHREGYITGYEQAEKETIERACKLLYDFNKQMTSMFGPKAFLSCNQYTIDIDRFRKILEMEEE